MDRFNLEELLAALSQMQMGGEDLFLNPSQTRMPRGDFESMLGPLLAARTQPMPNTGYAGRSPDVTADGRSFTGPSNIMGNPAPRPLSQVPDYNRLSQAVAAARPSPYSPRPLPNDARGPRQRGYANRSQPLPAGKGRPASPMNPGLALLAMISAIKEPPESRDRSIGQVIGSILRR